MNLSMVLRNRQYNLSKNLARLSSSVPVFESNYFPPSSFESLNVNGVYEFFNSNHFRDSPITTIFYTKNSIFLTNDVGDISMLDKNTFKCLTKSKAHNGAIFDLKLRPNHENQILTGAGDRSILLQDLVKSQSIMSFPYAHYGSVKTLSFQSPNVFASGGRDGAIKLWDLRTTCALKHGPVSIIADAHIHKLPSLKSPRNFRTAKSRRLNPIALSSENINYHPSNVVTCVEFDPLNENSFYSSGIADNSIKVWDIRRSHRQCSGSNIMPYKIHTIKNALKSSAHHGYSSFFLSKSSSNKLLYASATNGNIYAFTSSSVNPVMVFSGRYSNHQTKISLFGENYLISGSTNGHVLIWNCNLKSPIFNRDEQKISIENRYPLYQINFDDQQEISIVVGDFIFQNIYCCSESYLWKFSFDKKISGFSEQTLPSNCHQYISSSENLPKTIDINLKRSSSFEFMASESKPLASITNWINLGTKRLKTNSPKKILKTPDNDENNFIGSKSTSQKTRAIKQRRYLRRSLFNDNRKIEEFFSTL